MAEKSISFTLTNKQQCFQCFQPIVEEFGAANGLKSKTVFHLTLVLDELITNIISYGYADHDEHPIEVSISLDRGTLRIRLEDDARPFNILEAPEPELDLPLEERARPIGGMGVHLVRNMMHNITYKRENGKNILLLEKQLTQNGCDSRN